MDTVDSGQYLYKGPKQEVTWTNVSQALTLESGAMLTKG